MLYISNTFSAKMIKNVNSVILKIDFNVNPELVLNKNIPFVGRIDNAFFAARAAKIIGVKTDDLLYRLDTELHSGDQLLVFQYMGPRLPEDATIVPPDAPVQWDLYSVI